MWQSISFDRELFSKEGVLKIKRVFGIFEAVFNVLYLSTALFIGVILIVTEPTNNTRISAGIMALVLAFGDAFHLIPRIMVIFTKQEERLRVALGRGKQITSITMTIFYLVLWNIWKQVFTFNFVVFWSYFIYGLAAIRILLCLLPQNKWKDRYSPIKWGIWRNIPFFLQGIVIAGLFFQKRSIVPEFSFMWLAIILSFAFYLPVVLWSNRNPKIGMLMLPKSCAYLWMLIICLAL